jgi:hypothetical protein
MIGQEKTGNSRDQRAARHYKKKARDWVKQLSA